MTAPPGEEQDRAGRASDVAAGFFEAAPVPAVVLSEEGCITLANDAFTRLVAPRGERILGSAFLDIVHVDDRDTVRIVLDPDAPGSQDRAAEVRLRSRSSGVVDVELLATPAATADMSLGAYVQVVDRRRQRQREEQLRALALVDELTGCLNRRGFAAAAEQLLRVAQREKRDVSLLFIDVDGLKTINDVHGHAVGDEVIRDAGDILRDVFRDADAVGRFGGDEFCVLALTRGPASAEDLRSRLEQAVVDHAGTRPVPMSLSVGLTHRPSHAVHSLEVLIREADRAMYERREPPTTSA